MKDRNWILIACAFLLLAGSARAQSITAGNLNFRPYSLGAYGSATGVGLADIDGNGEMDLILSCGRHVGGLSAWFLNKGNGNFTAGFPLGDSLLPAIGVAVGFINNDNRPDLILGSGTCNTDDCDQGPSYVFLNQGKMPFYGPVSDSLPGNLRSLGLCSFDGYGPPAAVIGQDLSNVCSVMIYPNEGGGQFAPNALDTLCQPISTSATTALLIKDLNGDGYTDIVVGNRAGWSSNFQSTLHAMAIFYGNADSTFGDPVVPDSTIGYQTLGLALADINQDGFSDIVAARGGENPGDSEGQQNVVYLFDPATGGFNTEDTLHYGTGHDATRGVAVADFNGDGRLDIVAGNQNEHSYIYLQDESGKYPVHDPDYALRITFSGKLDTRAVAAWDFDGNGLQDIVFAVDCANSDTGWKTCSSFILFQED